MSFWMFVGDTGFSPPDIGNLELWLDASNTATLNGGSISDNDAVSAWNDASGNGNNTSQSNASYRPTYKTNIINGQPAILFTAGSPSDGLDMGTTALIATGSPFTMIAVAKQSTQPSFAVLANWYYAASDNMQWGTSSDVNYRYFWWGGNTWATNRQNVTDLGTAAWHTIITTYDGDGPGTAANWTFLLDTVSKTVSTGSGIGGNGQNGCVGAYFAAGVPTAGWDGYIAEIMLYNKVLNAGELTQIADYVSNKYGI